MKITVEYEVSGCKDCPYLTKGKTYGNDGRDGVVVYICEKGAYGCKKSEFGDLGLSSIPLYPPKSCPFFNSTPTERLASKLNMDVKRLEKILKEESIDIIDIEK